MIKYLIMNNESQITSTIKNTLPAVVSIIISKYLPVFESPFKPDPLGFEDLFAVPKGRKKVKVGGGSGFIVDKSGIILTNRHVVLDPKADYIAVLNNNKKYKVKVLARDSINDIAIVKIKENNLPILKLGNSSNVQLGQTVIAIGNTLATFQNTVSVGVISGLSRQIKAVNAIDRKLQSLKGLIQTDAAINPGNSGGPLVNTASEAIGVNCAMAFGAQNVGFTIPINAAKKDLEDLKKYGKIRQPFLGLRYLPINKRLQKEHNMPVNYGALVISEGIPERKAVISGSPAEKAGIKEADIILEIQNSKINTKNTIQDILQKYKVGDKISLKILRNGRNISKKIILADKI